MADVKAGAGENFESLLQRFHRQVVQDGVLAELHRHEYYEKPSIQRKRKKVAKKRGAVTSANLSRR